VLFIHGLESSATGRKYQAIAKSFQHVRSVDMSAYCNLRKHWMSQPYLTVIPFLCTIPAIPLLASASPHRWSLVAAASVASLVAIALCVRWGALGVVRKCMELQQREIESFQPDVVVGSSFGGAIAAFLLLEGSFRGPALLLAPAYGIMVRVCRLLGIQHLSRSKQGPSASSVLVVLGTGDKLITAPDTARLAADLAAFGLVCRVVTVQDSHSLARMCRPVAGIREWIHTAIMFHNDDASSTSSSGSSAGGDKRAK
jgi:hypothetical protein